MLEIRNNINIIIEQKTKEVYSVTLDIEGDHNMNYVAGDVLLSGDVLIAVDFAGELFERFGGDHDRCDKNNTRNGVYITFKRNGRSMNTPFRTDDIKTDQVIKEVDRAIHNLTSKEVI